VGKIAGQGDHDCAEAARNFAHAFARQRRRVGNAPLRGAN
jgi:hypothetical protein